MILIRRRRGPIVLRFICSAWIAISAVGCEDPAEDSPNPKAPSTVARAQDSPTVKAGGAESTRTEGGSDVSPSPATTLIGERPGLTATKPYVPSNRDPSPFRFREIAKESGVDFVHYSAMNEHKYFPSANGSGLAIFDYNNDGLMDLYFATCVDLPLGSKTGPRGTNKLYKNLGGLRFEDVTAKSGLGFSGFCNGIVTGDIDGDGDVDVFLANYGGNKLFENLGDGTFKDISIAAGVAIDVWSSGGAFLDYDNDGDLDLYVANYGKWSYPEDDKFCGDAATKIRLYCTPRSIRLDRHILYRNNGDKTFTDVTEKAGVSRSPDDYGHGFGVVTCDINGDGLIDIFVANDTNPNFLFYNKGDGTFEDAGLTSGAAFDEGGQARSGMGVDAEDVNGDGRPDLFVTNFSNEPNTLYINMGAGGFLDSTSWMGLAADSLPWVGWGCALADFDNDGRPDCFVTNGHVDDNLRKLGRDVDYEQPALLCRNIEGKRFKLATTGVGPYFDAKHVGRGAAIGDLDNDGDLDIVVNQRDSAPAILINETPTKNMWIRFVFHGTKSNREGIGALVRIDTGKLIIERQRKGGSSMSSSNDPRLLVGLGEVETIPRVTVVWPSGAENVFENVKPNQTLEIVEKPALRTTGR